jgi:hypothetical protein
MFQLSNHMYTAYDGRCEIAGERTTALVREENSSIKAQMSHLS